MGGLVAFVYYLSLGLSVCRRWVCCGGLGNLQPTYFLCHMTGARNSELLLTRGQYFMAATSLALALLVLLVFISIVYGQ